jgi:hypothetical protein
MSKNKRKKIFPLTLPQNNLHLLPRPHLFLVLLLLVADMMAVEVATLVVRYICKLLNLS